jgi:hypothetical protein
MTIIFSCMKGHYMARASIFLVLVALVAGMAGCAATPAPAPQYDLTIFYL